VIHSLGRKPELAAQVITAGRIAFRNVLPCMPKIFPDVGLREPVDGFLQGLQVIGGHQHGGPEMKKIRA